MVRTMIRFPPRDHDADRFVAGVVQAEKGGLLTPHADPNESEAVWDALGALDAADFEIPANDARPNAPSRRTLLVGAGLAAGVAAMIGGGLLWSQRPQIYATEVGERRTVLLSDGSEVTLNTDTRIEVRLSSRGRLVKLDRGEAFFAVTHLADTTPFDVVSDGVRIQVTGTRFNVRRDPASIRVDLLEGRISVGSLADETLGLTLRPGQGVRLSPGGAYGPVVRAQLGQIDDWRNGRISFDHTPLAAAAAEMNRYSRIQLSIVDRSLGQTPVDGVFVAGDSAAFAEALQALHGVSIQRDGEVWTVSP